MNDDTRLRDGSRPRESPQASVATGAGEQPELAASSRVYAALDLGTNNCRLLIACPAGDGFRVIDSFSRIIRLGEGISASGCISDAAIERAVAALSVCRDKIASRKAKRLRLIATEACRAASNAEGFRDRVAAETGIRLEVIDRETEAALAMLGCSPLLDQSGRGAILFDIGGGSTELVRIERDPQQQNAVPRIRAWMSIPLGVVTLAEHFGGRDVTAQSYALMVQEVAKHIAPFATEYAADREIAGQHARECQHQQNTTGRPANCFSSSPPVYSQPIRDPDNKRDQAHQKESPCGTAHPNSRVRDSVGMTTRSHPSLDPKCAKRYSLKDAASS